MFKKTLSVILVLIIALSAIAVSAVETFAASDYLTVTAKSNYFPTSVASYDENTKQVTVTYYFQCNKGVLNTQWYMYYDPSVLIPSPAYNNAGSICPTIGSATVMKLDATGDAPGRKGIKYIAANLSLFDFSKKAAFASVTFDVVAKSSANTTVDLYVNTLGVSQVSSSTGMTDASQEAYIVDNGVVNSGIAADIATELKGAGGVTDDAFLTVNTTSNYFPTITTKYDKSTKQITVTYSFKSSKNVLDTEWYMYYDPSVLVPAVNASGKNINTRTSLCPTIGSSAGPINLAGEGDTASHKSIIYSANNLGLFDFSTMKVFATAVFDVVTDTPAVTNINLYVNVLRVSEVGDDDMTISEKEEYLVKDGVKKTSDVKVELKTEATPSTYSEKKYMLGDVDSDGKITVMDATEIQKYLAQISAVDEAYIKLVGDTDGDGKITVMDATEIQKFLAQLPCNAGIGKPM